MITFPRPITWAGASLYLIPFLLFFEAYMVLSNTYSVIASTEHIEHQEEWLCAGA